MSETRRILFLKEMGLTPLWSERTPSMPDAGEIMPENHALMPIAAENDVIDSPLIEHATPFPEVSVPVSATPGMDWLTLQEAVADCTLCGLSRTRTKTVFGTGDRQARWLFIGEGPGRNEDAQGLPFVGPAGKLLDNMMLAMGLRRGENTFIANIVKCRAADENRRDRPPTPEESAACMPYLQRQIALIAPTVIIALGKSAAITLLEKDPATPVSRLRGTVHRYAGIPLVVTYHPAYLLRSLGEKSKAWADLCMAMDVHAAEVARAAG